MKKPAASLFVLLVPGLILLLFSCNPSHITEKKSAKNDNLIVFADPEPPHKEHGMAWIPGEDSRSAATRNTPIPPKSPPSSSKWEDFGWTSKKLPMQNLQNS